jgi:hypothetical protein
MGMADIYILHASSHGGGALVDLDEFSQPVPVRPVRQLIPCQMRFGRPSQPFPV